MLKIHTDEGITGIAETGDTSLWYMGESQDSIMSNIVNVFAPQILIGEDPFNIETIVAKMDKATHANNHSKAVVDYALHDLMGKALGVPIYKLLGGLSNPEDPAGVRHVLRARRNRWRPRPKCAWSRGLPGPEAEGGRQGPRTRTSRWSPPCARPWAARSRS